MEKNPSSLDEAVEIMNKQTRARGLMHLSTIFGELYTRTQLQDALELHSLNIDRALEYLQDNLPISSIPNSIKNPQPEETIELSESPQEKNNNEPLKIQGPKTGKIGLEFSLSPEYIDSQVPIFYITDEIIKEIFSFLSGSDRAKMASVCRSWRQIDLKAQYLYKRDSLNLWKKTSRPELSIFPHPFNSSDTLWGPDYPSAYNDSADFLRSFKTWRNVFVKRPRIRTNGVYVSRVVYFKQGQPNIENLPVYHKIVFFRYLRFFPDFSLVCINTAKKPREMIKIVNKDYADSRLGEWARSGEKLKVHLLAKSEIFTYNFNIKSSQAYFFDILKLIKVETRSPSSTEYQPLNINNDAWPKTFKFVKVRF